VFAATYGAPPELPAPAVLLRDLTAAAAALSG